MKLNDYQRKQLTFLSPMCTVTKKAQLTNAVLGITGEGGECADILKKVDYHGHEFDRDKFILELGDVLFYVSEGADAVDCTLEEVAMRNIAKLDKRYPSGAFTVQDSINKNDQIAQNLDVSTKSISPHIKITSIKS